MQSGDEEQNSWEFDTVRARSSTDTQGEPINEEVDEGLNRSVVNTRIPASLRLLFGEESRGPSKDAFSGFPGTGQLRSRSNTPTVGLGTGAAESYSHIPDRDKPPSRRHGGGGGEHTSDETVRRLDFVFPPRSGQPSRTKSKLASSIPTSEDEDRQPPSPERERARLPHLGPVHVHGHSHGHGRGIGDATMSTHSVTPHGRASGNISSSSNDMFPTGSPARANPSYKDVRTSRGLPNISIPPVNMHGSLDMTFDSPADITATEELQQSSSPSKSNFSMPLFNRKRSQSSATASSSTSPRKLNFPSDFHFPPVASTANIAGPSLPPPISSFNRAKSHNAMSPSHGSLSSSSSESRSPAAHQTTHSLDNNAIYNQRLFKPSASSLGPGVGQDTGALSPSYSRANEQLPVSGQPLSRRPSVTRQASVAVMETVHSTAIDIKQDLPSAKIDPDSPVPILGLKDVLKVPALTHEMHGMPDLLPPSPSAASSNRRFFAPTPSSLGSNVFAPDLSNSHVASFPQLRPPLSPLAPPGSVQANAPGSPRPDLTDMSTTVSGSGQSTQTSGGHKLSSSVSSVSSLGPPLRPLDLGSMMSSHELTHGELARTVDELLQWLSIVETGLTTVLQKTAPMSDAFGGTQAPAIVQPFSSVQEEEQESFEDALNDSATSNMLNGDSFTDSIDSALKKNETIDDDDDDEAEEGTFEQFLAKMQQRNRIREEQEQEGESSSDGEAGAFDHTVRPFEQLAANVTV